MHAPEYIRAIWSGDMEKAVEEIYRTNPLGHVCGRVCTHRCESACSLGVRGEPIAIRWLKRHALDNLDHEQIKSIVHKHKTPAQNPGRIAIVGAGPAGLTAAYDLAINGHQVTLFDGLPEPGGMMRYGIPEYRLPYARINDDIDVIQSLGVEIHCNTWIGSDISMEDIERDYDAVLVAIGLHKGRSTRIPGSDHAHVVAAIDVLRDITLGKEFTVPQRAVIIGGGNVAMDVARSLLRLQKQKYNHVDITVSTLETREQMQAASDEIREAEEEGVVIQNGRGPRECVVDEDTLTGLETVCCLSVFDDDGRFHPRYDEDDVCFYNADMVIEAIGQAPGNEFLGEALTERLEWERGRLKVDAQGRSSEAWLWAAGDAVQGPDVVHAIAGGHKVASSIQQYLNELVKESA
jgi:glutamate synthase (NADPH/NADH) small chain